MRAKERARLVDELSNYLSAVRTHVGSWDNPAVAWLAVGRIAFDALRQAAEREDVRGGHLAGELLRRLL